MMTKQEIEAFALQYHGIECVRLKNEPTTLYSPFAAIAIVNGFVSKIFTDQIEYIELRSIDSLTDEEEIEIADILGLITADYFLESIQNKERYICSSNYAIQAFDYLKSIGIAVPFRGYTVEQMIEQGFLKIKQ